MARRIWIIGASSGIGAALARAYAREGAELILSARDASALETLAQELGGAQVLPLDLAEAGALSKAATVVGGTLDTIHCTAALYDPGAVADIDDHTLDQIIRVNLTSLFHLGKCAPDLLVKGGQLVIFGSVAGYVGLPKGQPYSATKAAAANLAESLRVELAPAVDVRLVSPGFVRTRLTDKNAFKMPAIISPEEAAEEVIKGLRGKQFEIHFPRRFTRVMKLLRALPYGISLAITARIGRS